ncbi:integrase, catalytic region, zinc finger, CCHC-type containing protein [Tanacetum coccineum]
MEKLENENVSLEFQVQSLIMERENVKLEYQKLFDSIKKTRSQTQKEINELIESVNQNTYAYGDVRSHNQDLLITISGLKAKLKTTEKGKFVNTKFGKPSVSNKLLCVTPINKNVVQKKKFVSKTEEKYALTKLVTSQTSPNKKKEVVKNTNVIAPGMYKVKINNNQEVHTKSNKSVLTSTGLKGVNSVRRPSSTSSASKNSVLSNIKIHSELVDVYAKTNVTSRMNVVKTKKHVANVDIKNALKVNVDVLCVSCDQNVLTPCHDKCLAKYNLSLNSNVIQIVLWIVDSRCSKHMNGNLKLLNNFVEKFIGTVRFGNDHFAIITGYRDYVHGNITICHVYYVEGIGHNLFLVGQFCDGDLEVAFRSKTCYVRNLEGDDLLTATSTKSWLLHRRLSNLNFGTINHLTKQDLFDGLPKFKDGKDHLCFAYEKGKSKKASL